MGFSVTFAWIYVADEHPRARTRKPRILSIKIKLQIDDASRPPIFYKCWFIGYYLAKVGPVIPITGPYLQIEGDTVFSDAKPNGAQLGLFEWLRVNKQILLNRWS